MCTSSLGISCTPHSWGQSRGKRVHKLSLWYCEDECEKPVKPSTKWLGKNCYFLHMLRLSSSLRSVYKYYNRPPKDLCWPMINSGERPGETGLWKHASINVSRVASLVGNTRKHVSGNIVGACAPSMRTFEFKLDLTWGIGFGTGRQQFFLAL